MVHCVQQHPEVVVAPKGRRYVARTYAAPRPDGRWDGWFVFLPLDGGRELATNWETTQHTLAHVRYWSEAISAVYLEGALRRAISNCPDEQLRLRAQRAEQEEALARAAAAAYAQAAAIARLAAKRARHNRRDAKAKLLAERAAAARAAAVLQAKAAAAARAEAAAAEQSRRDLERRSHASGSAAHATYSAHPRRGEGGARVR
jgi:hypothetical protein